MQNLKTYLKVILLALLLVLPVANVAAARVFIGGTIGIPAYYPAYPYPYYYAPPAYAYPPPPPPAYGYYAPPPGYAAPAYPPYAAPPPAQSVAPPAH